MVCAILMVLLVFQNLGARATKPNTGANEYNFALSAHGGVATASGSSGSNTPARAIDGGTNTYWQSSSTTGWLAVAFASNVRVNEIHAHFLAGSTAYPSLSLYLDTNANGAYDSTEKLWTTRSNAALDVVIPVATADALGMKLSIDAKVGSKVPKIAEFEAYLRYDTDGDGLTSDEEVSLGRDGYVTNPWLADTDADGVADGLEANGWSRSGSTIVADPNGFRTDPTRADTDRDGVPDGRDYAPTGDAFVQVTLNSIVVRGTGASDGDATFHPFGSITVGSETSYSAYGSVAPGVPAYLNHQYTVNVDDATPSVSITIRAWDYDTSRDSGSPDDVHTALAVAKDTSYGGCSGVASWTFTYEVGSAPPPFTSDGYCPGADSRLRADPITVTVRTVTPPRVETLLVVPMDYSGVYNVTDAGGNLVSRRYVGEPRFVPILVNVSGVVSFDPKVLLVPRTVFFDTQLDHLLATGDVGWLPPGLAFRQNDTSASSNSDALQEILSGNVSGTYEDDEYGYLLSLLENNVTWNLGYRVLRITDASLADALFLYSLPDDALRLVGYGRPTGESNGRTYRFCGTPNCGGPTTPVPLWERIWNGIVSTVGSWISSAVVLAVTAFAKLGEILSQVGNWVLDMTSGDPVRIARAVQAAQKVFDGLVDAIVRAVNQLVQGALAGPLAAMHQLINTSLAPVAQDIALYGSSSDSNSSDLPARVSHSLLTIGVGIALIPAVVRGLEGAFAAATFGMEWLIAKLTSKAIAQFIVKSLAFTALVISASVVVSNIVPETSWAEATAKDVLQGVGLPISVFAALGSFAVRLLTALTSATMAQPEITRRYVAFGLSVLGMVFVALNVGNIVGPGRLLLDFFMLLTSMVNLAIYYVDSAKVIGAGLDFLSSISSVMEQCVAFGAPLAIAGAMLVRWQSHAYD